MSEFISRSKATAIRRALGEMILEKVQAGLAEAGLAEELYAAARTGDVAAVRARLQRLRNELDASVDGLVAAAIAEINADEEDRD